MTLAHEKKKRLLTAITLTLILALGAFLRLYKLGAYSIGNTYYAATVKSMLTSWHNFFYAAFEPGGSVTVDKPPLGFWVQAIFAYFLGVNGFALALPQALAGVLSIGVLFHLVKKHFGAPAGLVAALALAVMPVTVATERNNTIDGLLVFVLLLAAWAFIKAAESGKTRHLLLGALLVGVGFNIKMLQAFMPLPAFYAVYFFGSRRPWWQRIVQLTAATVVLFVVSFAWVAVVDLTPPEERPYIGSSENNTVTELIIGHNGLRRLGLLQRGPDGNRPGPGLAGPPANPPSQGTIPSSPGNAGNPPRLNVPPGKPGAPSPPAEALAACENAHAGEACAWTRRDGQPVNGVCVQVPQSRLACAPPAVARSLSSAPGQQPPLPGGSAPGGGPGRSNETGQAGVLRLFQEPLVTEASWLLVFVLLGLPLALVTVGWEWPLEGRQMGLLLWTAWLLPEMAYFSFTTGLFHRYYLIMLGPPLAALTAIALWSLARQTARRPMTGWLLTAFIAGSNL
ncbi:MAG: dolichyl-phosphate-mannose--protein mannosyltransferase, partial [Anaerolineae bacterium]